MDNGWYRIDGDWRMKIDGAEAQVRQSAGKTELIVPMRLVDGKAQIVQEFAW